MVRRWWGVIAAVAAGLVLVVWVYNGTRPTTLEDVGEEAAETTERAGDMVRDRVE